MAPRIIRWRYEAAAYRARRVYSLAVSLFPQSWRRVDRAAFHLKAFQAEWERVVGPEAHEIVTEPNDDWTQGTVRAVPRISRENTLAIELGEFFYQLRAALDATVYQAALFVEATDPPADEDRLEFPIYAGEKRFKNSAVYIGKFPDDLKRWFESIQPYNAAKTADADTLLLIKYLRLIHDCARKDRHRQLHIVAAYPTRFACEFEYTPSTLRIRSPRRLRVNLLESDEPFFFFDIEGADLTVHNKIKLKTTLQVEVSVDQIPVAPGGRMDTEIKGMCAAVEFVIKYFESGFAR
jgi:hypothetical protein